MKTTCSLLLILVFFLTAKNVDAQIDVLYYKFEITLSDSSDLIKGTATIRYKVQATTPTVSMDLVTVNKAKKGMNVTEVTEGNRPLGYIHKENKIIITPSTAYQAGEEKEIRIRYEGVPADGLIISKNKYGHRTFFADNWPDRARNWLPCMDEPGDKALVEFLVTAPSHYQVVSNGIETEETNLGNNLKITHWKENTLLPTKVMVIGVADFAVELSGTVDGIPVYAWVYPEDKQKGFYDYGLAPSILSWYIKNIGPYGYEKLANVQSKTIFGGMENASAIFYAENSINGKRTSESLLAHEIAHQWFGNMATEKNFSHLWLSEGFATYMTILYLENKYGPDTLQSMLQKDREQVIAFSKNYKHPVVDTAVNNYMELLNANSYQKGSWVLHMLHRSLGDSVFWKSLRKYYAAYAGKNASTGDLQKVFEDVSGKKLDLFFRQWLYTPGQPQLSVTWSYNEKEKQVSVTVTQLQKDIFQFPLEIHMQAGTGTPAYQTLQVSKDKETFILPAKEKITRILLDPKIALLFEGSVKEQLSAK